MKNLLLVLILLISPTAFGLNSQQFRPAFPGFKTWSLIESTPQARDTLSLGLDFNYAYHPLQFANNLGRSGGVADQLYTFNMQGAYSLSDRLALGLLMPVHVVHNIESLTGTNMESSFNVGDLQLSGLLNIFERGRYRYDAGLGLVPFISFPTGANSNFVGDADVTGGVLAAGDINLNGTTIIANVGFRFRGNESLTNLEVGPELLYALGAERELFTEQQISGFVELAGSSVLQSVFTEENEAPLELRLGGKKNVNSQVPFTVTAGGGLGLTNGYGSPDFRLGLGLSYNRQAKNTVIVEKEVVREVIKEVPVEVRIEKVERELQELTIYYPTDGSQVDPFYEQKISGIVQILKDNPDLSPLYIVGHTDNVGSDSYNRGLSERRAQMARDSVLAQGLAERMIVWLGLGEATPVVENSSDANRALNRRTLFTFVKPKQLNEGNTAYNSDSYTEVLKQRPVSKPVAKKIEIKKPTNKTVVKIPAEPKASPVTEAKTTADVVKSEVETDLVLPVAEPVLTDEELADEIELPSGQ